MTWQLAFRSRASRSWQVKEDLPGFRLQESQGGGQAGVVKPVEGVVQDQWRFRYEGPAHCQAQGQVQLVSGSIAAPDQGCRVSSPAAPAERLRSRSRRRRS